MMIHEPAVKASSLSKCTSINTSTFGTLSVQDAYNIQSVIDREGTIKATMAYKPKTKTINKNSYRYKSAFGFNVAPVITKRPNDLEGEIEKKKDRSYISSGMSKISQQKHLDQATKTYALKTASQLSSCGNHCWINSVTGKVRGHSRCKSHACPYCINKKLGLRIQDFNQGLKFYSLIDLEYNFVSLVTVKYVRKPKTHTEQRKQALRLNKAFATILGYRKYRDSTLGTVRSIEGIESKYDKTAAHVHLHVLALTKKMHTFFPIELKEKLSRLIGEDVIVYVRTEDRKKDESEAIEQIKKGFYYLHKALGLKTRDSYYHHSTFGTVTTSSIRSQSIEFYLNWTRAIKGLRLYNSTGTFREILRLGKLERTSSYEVQFLPLDETDRHQRKNEVLLYWKRDERMINGELHDLGTYYVSPVYLESFQDEMKLMLPPRSKVFLGTPPSTAQPISKVFDGSPPIKSESASPGAADSSPGKTPHWSSQDSQLDFGFINAVPQDEESDKNT